MPVSNKKKAALEPTKRRSANPAPSVVLPVAEKKAEPPAKSRRGPAVDAGARAPARAANKGPRKTAVSVLGNAKAIDQAAATPAATGRGKTPAKSTSPAKAVESPVTPIEPARRRRSNRRSQQTIDNILLVTERIVLESGAHRISILDVCKAAGVSRGTFYRYFASQEELLDAFSRHKRETFHHSLQEATLRHDDPDDRFAALVAYLESYLEHGNSRRLLIVAPEYALGFFKRIFHDSVVRFQDVLRPVFDAWDERLGVKLDRELVCEMLIRYVLSEQLAPGDAERKGLTRRVARMVEALTAGAPSRARR